MKGSLNVITSLEMRSLRKNNPESSPVSISKDAKGKALRDREEES